MTMAKNRQKNKKFWLEDIVSSMANGRDENMKIPFVSNVISSKSSTRTIASSVGRSFLYMFLDLCAINFVLASSAELAFIK
jgi:hypothetical protein